MIQSGFTIENPITGSRTVLIEGDAETGGSGWLLESHTVPHAAPDVPEHFHTAWSEEFEILSGQAHYSLDGVEQTAGPGDRFVVGPGQRHIHPWNGGDTEMVYRQRDNFNGPDAGAVQDVLGVFATIAELARQGKVNAQGRVKNPLQQAVMLKVLNRHGGYDASIPRRMQDVLAVTLGSIGELAGYRAIDPAFGNQEQ